MALNQRTALTLAIKTLIAVVLIVAIGVTLDLEETKAALAGAHPMPILGAFSVSVLGVLVSAEKWRGLLSLTGIRLSVGRAASLYWIGMFVSNFLPTSIGGDAVRLLLAPGARTAVAGSILVERLTGFLVLLALCTAGLSLRPGYFDEPGLRTAFLTAVLLLSLGVIAALVLPGRLVAPMLRLTRRLPPSLRGLARSLAWVAATTARLAGDTAALWRAILLSILFYGLIILAQYGVLRAVGAEVALTEVALVAAVVPLLTMLPVSLNGLGLAEGVFVLLYAQLGVPAELALAAAVLRRLVDLANSSLGGLLWLTYRAELEGEERGLGAGALRGRQPR